MIINILGTQYKLIEKEYNADTHFKNASCDGYCDDITKEIVTRRMKTYPGYENENEEYCRLEENATKRHEIVHAYFNESGLKESSLRCDRGWARNEEMIDWIAVQGGKIYETWRLVGCV